MGRGRLIAVIAFIAAVFGMIWRPVLPAVTLASFPGAVIVMDDTRQAVCLGDVSSGEAARFVLFYGAKIQLGASSSLSGARGNRLVRQLSSGLILLQPERQLLPIIVIDGGASVLNELEAVPNCSAAVITGPVRAQTAGVGNCQEGVLPYSGQPPDIAGITAIIKRAGVRWVVVNCEPARFRRQWAFLEKKLHEVPTVHVLRTRQQQFILVTGAGNARGLELKLAFPESDRL